ncbi:hypothetical protein EBR96_00535, partial [bacterium]|nr:hypothetical protein [bacterium]
MDLGISSAGARRRSIFEPTITSSPKVDEKGGVKKAFSVEELQGTNKNVTAASPVEAPTKVAPITQTTKADAPTAPSTRETIARPMSRADIVDQLVQLHKAPTPDNIQIVSTILQYGLEASVQNFDTIQTLIKGRKTANAMESSVVSLSKGLAETPRSVDIIGHFLNNQTQVAQQLQQLQMALSQFQSSLTQNTGILDTGLQIGLASVLNELDDTLKKLSKKADDRMDWSAIKRGAVIGDFKAMYEFIGGLRHQMANEPGAARLAADMAILQEKISGFLESMTSQAIMSEHAGSMVGNDRFGYWQFPNPWMNKQSVIELLIRKDPLKKKAEINPQKTRIVLKLET